MNRVIIADDHTIVREGIASIINATKDFTVVAQAENGERLLQLLKTKECDLVLCDIVMPGLDGLKALKKIKASHPETKVVIITMHQDRGFFSEAVKSGANGYVLKDDSSTEILTVLRGVAAGHRCFSPRIQTMLAKSFQQDQAPEYVLTKREYQIFKLIAKAYTHQEIADELKISLSTVEFHKKNIKDKLDVKNLAELLNVAHKYDIV